MCIYIQSHCTVRQMKLSSSHAEVKSAMDVFLQISGNKNLFIAACQPIEIPALFVWCFYCGLFLCSKNRTRKKVIDLYSFAHYYFFTIVAHMRL